MLLCGAVCRIAAAAPLPPLPQGPSLVVPCCGIAHADGWGVIRSAPPALERVQEVELVGGCLRLDLGPSQVAVLSSEGEVAYFDLEPEPRVFQLGERLWMLGITASRACRVSKTSLRPQRIGGTVARLDSSGLLYGEIAGCGLWAPLDPEGGFEGEAVPSEGCALQATFKRSTGARVGGERWPLREDVRWYSFTFVPREITRVHRAQLWMEVTLLRDDGALSVSIREFWTDRPRSISPIPDRYRAALRNSARITAIDGRPVRTMSDSELVDAADRLLQSIEAGAPIPFTSPAPRAPLGDEGLVSF